MCPRSSYREEHCHENCALRAIRTRCGSSLFLNVRDQTKARNAADTRSRVRFHLFSVRWYKARYIIAHPDALAPRRTFRILLWQAVRSYRASKSIDRWVSGQLILDSVSISHFNLSFICLHDPSGIVVSVVRWLVAVLYLSMRSARSISSLHHHRRVCVFISANGVVLCYVPLFIDSRSRY